MDADRVVERPEDQEEKKKSKFGFFGRKSYRRSSGKMSSVSRPPSTMWQSPTRKKASEPQEQVSDEDLPPRMSSPQDSDSRSGTSTPGPSKHAGFDFEAIHTVLEEARIANSDHSELEVQADVIEEAEAPIPILRSVSAPISFLNEPSQEEEVVTRKSAPMETASQSVATTLQASESSLEDGDLGDITYKVRPPPAPSLSFGSENAWTTDREAPVLPPKDHPPPNSKGLPREDAEEGDITVGGSGWRAPSAGKHAFFSNPWGS